MARTLALTSPGKLATVVYVVDGTVGAGCRNQREDVLLVQFFLRVLGPRTVSAAINETFQPKNAPPLAIDGVCGQRTLAAIKSFQTQFDKAESGPDNPGFLLQDGVVHPPELGTSFGPRSGHVLTIIRLNTEYASQFGLDRHKRIDTDPLFPRELLKKLFLQT